MPLLKRIAPPLVGLGVLYFGVSLFQTTLMEYLPANMAEQQARERRVPLDRSLATGEELVSSAPAVGLPPPAGEAPPVENSAVNLVVSLVGSLSGENGASVAITATPSACPEATPTVAEGFRQSASHVDEPELASALSRTFCVLVRADSLYSVKRLTGEWRAAGLEEQPQLEGAAKQLEFVSPAGITQVLSMTVVGYCSTAEGGCNSTLEVSATAPAQQLTTKLNFQGSGELPLTLSVFGG